MAEGELQLVLLKMSEKPDPVNHAERLLAEARTATDAIMESWAQRLLSGDGDGPALAYALRSPGKRVRAALVLASYRALGGKSPAIASVAAAVETVHTYSLVHDDLPCMDDDDLRRGRPTTHRAFDVVTATRVGYRLVPAAALVLAQAADDLALDHATLGRMAGELFQASGIEGMVGGQWLDLEAEQRALDLAELSAVHRGKTGALIRAACILGALAAKADPRALAALSAYGEEIGLAFQVADDVLDVTGTSDQLGKTAGKDEQLQKSTFVRLMGVDGARREAGRLAAAAVAHLAVAGIRSESLNALADYIVNRKS
jgi:farnesyl diphosphate synthase/geranylgeranyl diphosphate synthase type II